MRIGQGYDVHAFGPGDHIILGGVRISHTSGIIAHSDGDVVIHALCDALLGALSLGDIGQYFSPKDERWRGADSRQFLRQIKKMMTNHHYCLGNADITIITEQPQIAPYANAMRQNLAEDLGCGKDKISIKATTSEKLGFTGRGEGIAALAIVLAQPV